MGSEWVFAMSDRSWEILLQNILSNVNTPLILFVPNSFHSNIRQYEYNFNFVNFGQKDFPPTYFPTNVIPPPQHISLTTQSEIVNAP